MVSTLALALLVTATPLEKARKQVNALDFDGAAKTLATARTMKDLTRDEVLELLELEGVVAATLKNASGARDAFSRLLNLAPDHHLQGRFSPRVTQPFFEARTWVLDHGSLELTSARPGEISLIIRNDNFRRVANVRVHLQSADGAWRTEVLPREGGVVEVTEPTKWWAEAVDSRNWTLVTLGSERSPIEAGRAALPPPPPPPSVASAAPDDVTAPPPPPLGVAAGPRPTRVLGYVLMGLAVGGAGMGTFFGVRASDARSQIRAAANEQGIVTTMSQLDAFALDERARVDSTIANTLFVSAAGTFIIGGILWLLGAEPAAAPAQLSWNLP